MVRFFSIGDIVYLRSPDGEPPFIARIDDLYYENAGSRRRLMTAHWFYRASDCIGLTTKCIGKMDKAVQLPRTGRSKATGWSKENEIFAPTNDTPHNQGDNGGLISIQIKFVLQGLRSLGLVVLTDFLICASLFTGLGAGNNYFAGNYIYKA